jgi:hypothetical protein
VLGDSQRVLEHGTSRSGRWLRARRTRTAFLIAAIEALLVYVFHDVSRWAVIGVAALALVFYLYVGRDARSDTVRQVSWIFAASQLLAVVAAILAFLLVWAAIVAVAVFAAIALLVVFSDRR